MADARFLNSRVANSTYNLYLYTKPTSNLLQKPINLPPADLFTPLWKHQCKTCCQTTLHEHSKTLIADCWAHSLTQQFLIKCINITQFQVDTSNMATHVQMHKLSCWKNNAIDLQPRKITSFFLSESDLWRKDSMMEWWLSWSILNPIKCTETYINLQGGHH